MSEKERIKLPGESDFFGSGPQKKEEEAIPLVDERYVGDGAGGYTTESEKAKGAAAQAGRGGISRSAQAQADAGTGAPGGALNDAYASQPKGPTRVEQLDALNQRFSTPVRTYRPKSEVDVEVTSNETFADPEKQKEYLALGEDLVNSQRRIKEIEESRAAARERLEEERQNLATDQFAQREVDIKRNAYERDEEESSLARLEEEKAASRERLKEFEIKPNRLYSAGGVGGTILTGILSALERGFSGESSTTIDKLIERDIAAQEQGFEVLKQSDRALNTEYAQLLDKFRNKETVRNVLRANMLKDQADKMRSLSDKVKNEDASLVLQQQAEGFEQKALETQAKLLNTTEAKVKTTNKKTIGSKRTTGGSAFGKKELAKMYMDAIDKDMADAAKVKELTESQKELIKDTKFQAVYDAATAFQGQKRRTLQLINELGGSGIMQKLQSVQGAVMSTETTKKVAALKSALTALANQTFIVTGTGGAMSEFEDISTKELIGMLGDPNLVNKIEEAARSIDTVMQAKIGNKESLGLNMEPVRRHYGSLSAVPRARAKGVMTPTK